MLYGLVWEFCFTVSIVGNVFVSYWGKLKIESKTTDVRNQRWFDRLSVVQNLAVVIFWKVWEIFEDKFWKVLVPGKIRNGCV